MKPSPRQEIAKCMSRKTRGQAVPKRGQPDSTGSVGRSRQWVQCEIFGTDLENFNTRTLAERAIYGDGPLKASRVNSLTLFAGASEVEN